MVFTKDGLNRLLITILISAVIYVLATLIFFEFGFDSINLFFSILLGSVIWFTTELLFTLVDKIWPHNILPGFVALCIVIILGTTVGFILFGIKDIKAIAFIDIIAVSCGLTIAIVSIRRYKKKLNEKLDEFKK